MSLPSLTGEIIWDTEQTQQSKEDIFAEESEQEERETRSLINQLMICAPNQNHMKIKSGRVSFN